MVGPVANVQFLYHYFARLLLLHCARCTKLWAGQTPTRAKAFYRTSGSGRTTAVPPIFANRTCYIVLFLVVFRRNWKTFSTCHNTFHRRQDTVLCRTLFFVRKESRLKLAKSEMAAPASAVCWLAGIPSGMSKDGGGLKNPSRRKRRIECAPDSM